MTDPNSPGQGYPYGRQEPPYGAEQSQPGAPQPQSGSQYGGQQPQYGAPQPQYGAQQPQYGAQQPQYGAQQPQYGGQQPQYGGQPTGSPFGQPSPYGQPADSPYGQPSPYGSPQPPTYAGAPGSPPPVFSPAPPKKRRVGRVLAIVGGALATVLVLCAVGGYFLIGRDLINEGNASLSTPDAVAGLKKSTNAEITTRIAPISAGLKAEHGFDDTIAAAYEDPKDSQKLVLLVGGTSLFFSPKSELDSAFDSFNAAAGAKVEAVTEVDAGELGGSARCGTMKDEDMTSAVCAWADHGSFVMGIFFNRDIEQSSTLLRQIRSEILTRG